MLTPLEVQAVERDGAAIVSARGEIDLATAPELQRHLESVMDRSHVVIDLLEIGFIDSTGLRVLILTDEAVRENGGRVTLVAGPGPVRKLFDITGVDHHMTITESVEAALS
jgi:anti-sigma B factor antagonist